MLFCLVFAKIRRSTDFKGVKRMTRHRCRYTQCYCFESHAESFLCRPQISAPSVAVLQVH